MLTCEDINISDVSQPLLLRTIGLSPVHSPFKKVLLGLILPSFEFTPANHHKWPCKPKGCSAFYIMTSEWNWMHGTC